MRISYRSLCGLLLAALLGGCGTPAQTPAASDGEGIHNIKHIIMIMQENRSYDSYFGTFPGADGIPMKDGKPRICAPDPKTHICVRPFHDPNDRNAGGPHQHMDAVNDIDHGSMDGFVALERKALSIACRPDSSEVACALPARRIDVMG